MIYTDNIFTSLVNNFFIHLVNSVPCRKSISKKVLLRIIRRDYGIVIYNKFELVIRNLEIPFTIIYNMDELTSVTHQIIDYIIANDSIPELMRYLITIDAEVTPAIKLISANGIESVYFTLTTIPTEDFIYIDSDGLYPVNISWSGTNKLIVDEDKYTFHTIDLANNHPLKLTIDTIMFCLDYICVRFEILGLIYFSYINLGDILTIHGRK